MNRKNIFGFAAVITATFLVYFNAINNGFTGDGLNLIVNNPYIKDWFYFKKLFTREYFYYFGNVSYRVIPGISDFINYFLFGLNPAGWHITVLLTHISCAILIYFIIYEIFKNSFLSFIAALFFAIHPIHTEIINDVSFVEDTQAFLFMLFSFFLYIKDKKILLSLFSFFLALLTKETAILFPFFLILYDFSFKQKFLLRRYIPYFLIFILWFFLINTFFYSPLSVKGIGRAGIYPGGNFLIAISTFIEAIPFYYLKQLFYPVNFIYEIGYPITNFDYKFILSILILILILISVFYSYKKHSAIFFGSIFFFLNLAPVSNIIPIMVTTADRYAYVSSFGFFLVIGAAILQIFNWKKPAGLIISIVLITLWSERTIRRNKDFQDPIKVYYKNMESKLDNDNLAHTLMGIAFAHSENNDYEKTLIFAKRALNTAKSPYRIASYLNDIGNLYWKMGDEEEAKKYFELFDKEAPDREKRKNYRPYFYLGDYYFRRNNLDKSEYNIKKGLEIMPYCALSYQNLGLIYLMKGDVYNAFQLLNKAKKYNSKIPNIWNNLGAIYILRNDLTNAEKMLNTALKFTKELPDVYYNLSIVEYKLGNTLLAEENIKKYSELTGKIVKSIPELPKGSFASVMTAK